MNIKRYILVLLAALLACGALKAADLTWFDGVRPVSYTVHGKSAPVVTTALQMFADDMRQVTGKSAVASKSGTIEIYELDKNKGAIGRLRKAGVPVDSIIGQHDCFWLGVRDGKILAVGSNGRGCAYAILELSRQAGVSPWVW